MPEQMWDTATAPVAAAAPTARVLVVDDEPSMRQMLSFALRREGYDVSTADDGRAALEALRDGRFDLVVTRRAHAGRFRGGPAARSEASGSVASASS